MWAELAEEVDRFIWNKGTRKVLQKFWKLKLCSDSDLTLSKIFLVDAIITEAVDATGSYVKRVASESSHHSVADTDRPLQVIHKRKEVPTKGGTIPQQSSSQLSSLPLVAVASSSQFCLDKYQRPERGSDELLQRKLSVLPSGLEEVRLKNVSRTHTLEFKIPSNRRFYNSSTVEVFQNHNLLLDRRCLGLLYSTSKCTRWYLNFGLMRLTMWRRLSKWWKWNWSTLAGRTTWTCSRWPVCELW